VNPPFGGRRLVVDNSAFQRGGHPTVRGAWARALKEGQLYRTPLLEFEVLYSARNPREYAELKEELQALHPLELTQSAIEAGLAAQEELAVKHAGFHRLAHPDYLVAAMAAHDDLGVLHYDRDFDRIAQESSLGFESVWIAPAGTLDDRPRDPLRAKRQAVTHALGQLGGERADQVLDRVLDLLERELEADGLALPYRP